MDDSISYIANQFREKPLDNFFVVTSPVPIIWALKFKTSDKGMFYKYNTKHRNIGPFKQFQITKHISAIYCRDKLGSDLTVFMGGSSMRK